MFSNVENEIESFSIPIAPASGIIYRAIFYYAEDNYNNFKYYFSYGRLGDYLKPTTNRFNKEVIKHCNLPSETPPLFKNIGLPLRIYYISKEDYETYLKNFYPIEMIIKPLLPYGNNPFQDFITINFSNIRRENTFRISLSSQATLTFSPTADTNNSGYFFSYPDSKMINPANLTIRLNEKASTDCPPHQYSNLFKYDKSNNFHYISKDLYANYLQNVYPLVKGEEIAYSFPDGNNLLFDFMENPLEEKDLNQIDTQTQLTDNTLDPIDPLLAEYFPTVFTDNLFSTKTYANIAEDSQNILIETATTESFSSHDNSSLKEQPKEVSASEINDTSMPITNLPDTKIASFRYTIYLKHSIPYEATFYFAKDYNDFEYYFSYARNNEGKLADIAQKLNRNAKKSGPYPTDSPLFQFRDQPPTRFYYISKKNFEVYLQHLHPIELVTKPYFPEGDNPFLTSQVKSSQTAPSLFRKTRTCFNDFDINFLHRKFLHRKEEEKNNFSNEMTSIIPTKNNLAVPVSPFLANSIFPIQNDDAGLAILGHNFDENILAQLHPTEDMLIPPNLSKRPSDDDLQPSKRPKNS